MMDMHSPKPLCEPEQAAADFLSFLEQVKAYERSEVPRVAEQVFTLIEADSADAPNGWARNATASFMALFENGDAA